MRKSTANAKKPTYRTAARALRALANPEKSITFQGFFKDTAGDRFLGVSTPVLRRMAREFWQMPLADVRLLMQSGIHEERSLANEILCLRFGKGHAQQRQEIFDFYLRNRRLIRSWDAVDGSAPYIVGAYLLDRDKKLLYQLAASPGIWERRIAMVSTLWFIRHGKIRDALKIARLLLSDKEDLIHKAAGWMLREIGKQNIAALKKFLDRH